MLRKHPSASISLLCLSLKFAPPVQGTPFTLGNLPTGLSEKLNPSAGSYRASRLFIPFQNLPGMTSTGSTQPLRATKILPARPQCAQSAGTKPRGSSRPISSAHCSYRVNRKHQEIQNTHRARGGADRIQLVVLAGTEKTLLSSEVSRVVQ